MCGKGCHIPPFLCPAPPPPAPALPPRCLRCVSSSSSLGASRPLRPTCALGRAQRALPWASSTALPGCKGQAALPQQAAAGGMRVPSVLHVPVLPRGHGCASRKSVSVRNAACASATWVPHLMSPRVCTSHGVRARCVDRTACALPIHRFTRAPRTGRVLHVCVWVKAEYRARPLRSPHTGSVFVPAHVLLACPA